MKKSEFSLTGYRLYKRIVTAKEWNKQQQAAKNDYVAQTGVTRCNHYFVFCPKNYGFCFPIHGGYLWRRTKKEFIGIYGIY